VTAITAVGATMIIITRAGGAVIDTTAVAAAAIHWLQWRRLTNSTEDANRSGATNYVTSGDRALNHIAIHRGVDDGSADVSIVMCAKFPMIF
jgi:hypothetical protein